MGKYRKRKKTWHHLNPRSRVPELLAGMPKPSHEFIRKLYRKKLIDDRLQVAWHRLFSNMFTWEAIEQIKLWGNGDLTGFKVSLNPKLWRAWQTVFGVDASPKDAIEMVKRDWWPEWPSVKDKLGEEK